MGKVAHIYNTDGQKVCSKEFRMNRHNTIEDIDGLKNGDKPICKKCANRIEAPYFSKEELFERSLKPKTD